MAAHDRPAIPPTLTHVGTHERIVDATLERVWENVYDWEHLPWLHHESFASIALEEDGSWGWRARIGLHPAEQGGEILLELVTERLRGRYVSRTLEGPGSGGEIWTWLEPRDAGRTAIRVEFHVPGVEPEQAPRVGSVFCALYARLWDQDEEMMRRRTDELAARGASGGDGPVLLGSAAALELPVSVAVGGRRYRVDRVDGEWLAFSAVCPHRLGPLEHAPIEDGRVRCPWHGYRFDVRSGASADGRRLRLPPAPTVELDSDGRVWVRPRS